MFGYKPYNQKHVWLENSLPKKIGLENIWSHKIKKKKKKKKGLNGGSLRKFEPHQKQRVLIKKTRASRTIGAKGIKFLQEVAGFR